MNFDTELLEKYRPDIEAWEDAQQTAVRDYRRDQLDRFLAWHAAGLDAGVAEDLMRLRELLGAGEKR